MHLLDCSIPADIYSNVRVVNTYLCGKQLHQLEYGVYVQYLLPFILH